MKSTKKQTPAPKPATKKASVTEKKRVMESLESVMDPELHMSIVDLGLVYDVTIAANKKTTVLMTLTTLGCPLFPMIEQDIHNKLYQIGMKDVKVDLTFDPPWSMERMTERAKATLGI
ncbi:metal-sulfur cluster assembly factor [Candidatus Microgenomates bacterium]|nr:metal-sulfur cluster assembly factor [Candidatus Microgenomates bacterium]